MSRRNVPEPTAAVRQWAVFRVLEGDLAREVAEWIGVSERSVWNWLAAWRWGGDEALATAARSGRPPKLNEAQVREVLEWVDHNAEDFGLTGNRWTAPRLAWLIHERLGVHLHPRYLNQWLRRHGVTPQIPQRVFRERDPRVIQGWLRHQWPRIKKRRRTSTPPSVSPTNRATPCCR